MKAALLVIMFAAATTPLAQLRDAQNYPSGTATLSGTVVVDEPNGAPLRRAFVTVQLAGDVRIQYQTATDDRGRFSIAGLPAANVRLVVSKPTYVMTYYGARQPGSTVGLPIALVDRQTTTVTVKVPRGSVITGVVRDENGQPMPGVAVRVLCVTMSAAGQRTLVSTSGALSPVTDDRGAYRVYGLAPGDYVVSASPRLAFNTEVRQTTGADLQWAEQRLRAAGAGSGAAASAADARPPALSQNITYAAVYFPNAINQANAGIVTLTLGQERSGIDLRMQFVPTAHITGTVTGADGQPARGVQITLFDENDSGGSAADAERLALMMDVGLIAGGGTATSLPDGSFTLTNVSPGNYTLIVRTGGLAGRAAAPGSSTELTWASSDVRVDGRDISGLALRLVPGQKISGRVMFEGAGQPSAPVRATVSLRAATARGIGVTVQPSLAGGGTDTLTVAGLIPAPYRVVATAPGWILKSAMLGDRDVADATLDVKPGEDVNGLVLTFTNTPAQVSGTLYDGAGKPMSDLMIVLFGADRASWFAGSRRVLPATRPASDGKFAFTSLPAGEYYLAALTDVTPADLGNPQFLDQVVSAAIRITVANGEKKTQDLKIAGR